MSLTFPNPHFKSTYCFLAAINIVCISFSGSRLWMYEAKLHDFYLPLSKLLEKSKTFSEYLSLQKRRETTQAKREFTK